MRNPPNETLGGSHTPERKCILSGDHAARDELIRLALGPDGSVAPDIRARAPGRGAWIGVDRAALDQAHAKGKLRAALARAFKAGDLLLPDDLGARVEAALRQAVRSLFGPVQISSSVSRAPATGWPLISRMRPCSGTSSGTSLSG